MGLFRLAAGSVCLALAAAAAQPFSFGVTAGAALTDPIEGSFGVRSEARRYAIGPTAEVRLPRSFAVEAGALYRRTGYGVINYARIRGDSWEFPVLAKRYFGRGVRPYAAAGFAIRQLTTPTAEYQTSTGIIRAVAKYLLRDNPTAGPIIAAGFSLRAGPLKLAPELRYTRWTGKPFNEEGSRGFYVRSTQNQLDILFSLTF